MGRLTPKEVVADVQARLKGKPSAEALRKAIASAYEGGMPIDPPNSMIFARLSQLANAGMLTGNHVTKTIELHVEARQASNEIYERGYRLFTESPRLAPAIAP